MSRIANTIIFIKPFDTINPWYFCKFFDSNENSLSWNSNSKLYTSFDWHYNKKRSSLSNSEYTTFEIIYIYVDTFTFTFMERWPSGSIAGFPIQGPRVQNHWVDPRWTQPFILPRSIKWVPGISGNLVVKSKLPPRSGCSLEVVEPHP